MAEPWRLLYNSDGDAADILAFPSALAEGRIAGKYMLSSETLPDTIVVQGVKGKGILAGADVRVDRELAAKEAVDVATAPRAGRRGAQTVGTVSLGELTSRASKKFKAANVDPDQPAVLLYTSGTTGTPKGVMLTHRNFLSQCSKVVSHICPVVETDIVVGVLPLYHVYGLANGLIMALFFGASFLLVPQYTPRALLEAIERNGATILIAIPTMYSHLLSLAKTGRQTIPKTLRLCVSGGAPLPGHVLKDFADRFQTDISEGYGLTESTSAVCCNQSGADYRPGSIGLANPGAELKVVDAEGREVPRGETGEIVIHSDVVTPGYWNSKEDTAETVREGWLYTGDLGYQDADGYFFITDRKKDLIIRGGYNISPREVEEVLGSHPAVVDAAVLGVLDRREREVVKAFVVTEEGSAVTEREIIEYCSTNLAAYKVPNTVEFRESIPKSATGKVVRRLLREDYQDERLIDQEA